jgi:hypothetical protein
MGDNRATDEEYDKWFKEAHRAGAERHGTLWLQANEFVCIKAMRMGIAATTKQNRAMLSVVTLSVLDSAKRFYEGPRP